MPKLALSAVALASLLSACAIGPEYVRPHQDLPASFNATQSTVPVADRWWGLFNDPVLNVLVEEALVANRDLRAAAARIDQARAQFGIARAAQLPSAGIRGNASRDRLSESVGFAPPPEAVESNTYRLVVSASWELDFWGKFRRATEAARAELAASEAGRDAIRASLVGAVVRGFCARRAGDESLGVAPRTLLGRRKSIELQQLRFDAGVVSELELRQVESDVAAAVALIPQLEQRRTRQESALALLLGRSPRAVFEGRIDRGTTATPEGFEVPAGLPSDLLLRRPDLREAEAGLHAATARIGVARAAYFPSISLTGFFGGESQQLSDLFKGPARTWSVGAGLLQPLFGAGQIAAGVDLADARTREAAALYEKALANAFRETRDAIAAQSSARDVLDAQRGREKSLARALDLARLRYDNGATSLFEVLETERQLLLVRLDAIDAERERRNAIVELYLALGG